MKMERQIELLARKALRRIEREGQFSSRRELTLIHARAVRAAQDSLDTTAANTACCLHNRINELMVESGVARWNGFWLEAA